MLHLIVIQFQLLLMQVPGVQAQTTYPIICRGGGRMTIHYEQNQGNAIMAYYTFKKSAIFGESVRALAPGECTWHDRVINEQEPVVLKMNLNALYSSPRLWKVFQNYNVGFKAMQPRLLLEGVVAPRRDVLVEMADPEKGMQFMVFNNGTQFEVRRIRY